MLLDKNSIGHRWRELLRTTIQIDIAVAWITSESLVQDLLRFATIQGRRTRVVSGYDDYLTSPTQLRLLHSANLLKLGVSPATGRFHPKVYLFRQVSQTLCWVGSANLTDAGFGRNVELVSESMDDGSARVWMDELWELSSLATPEWLDAYEAGWQTRQVREQLAERLPRLKPPPTGPLSTLCIFQLSLMALAATIEPLLRAAMDDQRIESATDFRSMCRELEDSNYRAISLRSFLWLLGWCNTDSAYRAASNMYAKPLAQAMFGYIPDQHLQVGEARVDLKDFRYGQMRDADTINTLIEYHRNRLS